MIYDTLFGMIKYIESIGRKEGAVNDSTLEKYKEKKADNPLNKQGLSTFSVKGLRKGYKNISG